MKEENKKIRIIIIGGVASGTSAAVKARRKSEELEIIIYEKDNFISYGTCGLPYYISGKILELDSLIINTVQGFEKRFNIKVKTMHEVLSIDPIKNKILVKDLKTGSEFSDDFNKLIIATGSIPYKLKIDGNDAKNVFVLKTIDDAIKLKDYMDLLEGKKDNKSAYAENTVIDNKLCKDLTNKDGEINAVLIGGGFVGLELLEAFLSKGFKVKIVEKTSQILPMFDAEIIKYLENYLMDKNIEVIKEDEITDFIKTGKNSNGDVVTLIRTSRGENIKCDLVFFGIGTKPNVELAEKAGIKIGQSDAISVNEFMQTNFKDIYAAGDCCECENEVTKEKKSFNLASIANRQGRIAGYNAAGGEDKFNTSLTTAVIKVLDLVLAKTGISFKEAKKINNNAVKLELHYLSHAGYYPGASMIHMLVTFDNLSGEILGYEAIGKSMVDKKADIFSVAIKNKMKLWDLASLDLGYHPEYGSAKDSINILGMIGENIKRNEVEFIDVEELKNKIKNNEKITILDVRTRKEYESGHIDGVVLIPIDELRENLDKLDKDDEIIIHCRTSYRSYLGYRILKNAGFKNVKNLNGSYLSWVRKI